MTRRGITRRAALRRAAAGSFGLAGGWWLTGCDGPGPHGGSIGSTLVSTWGDPVGDGQLRVMPGEAMVSRTELGPRMGLGRELAVLAHLTDAHVLDSASPARVTFLDRLGPPFGSTFRPQETLTTQVLAGAVAAVRALRPALVLQGGDLIDNDASDEMTSALGAMNGGLVRPPGAAGGYFGVQSESDPDPFYYRPDVDSPRHPGLLRAASAAVGSPGLGTRWVPVLGDHDILVQGELAPDALTAALAVGGRALWDLSRGLDVPPGLLRRAVTSPDGPPAPGQVDSFLREALRGPTVEVPADAGRREMHAGEVVRRQREAAGRSGARFTSAAVDRLDYLVDVGTRVRVVALDLAARGGGSGGVVVAGQRDFVRAAIADAGRRWVVIVSHQPLADSVGGETVQQVLDASPQVLATLAGHLHRNRISPRRTPAGGYWEIVTASLIDFPQQSRAIRVIETAGGGVALQTWMLDHALPGPLGRIARQLSYLDSGGGRPGGFAGLRHDRNAVLFRSGRR